MTPDELDCTNIVFDITSFSALQETCIPLCPLECNKTEYRYSSTSIEVIGDIYVDFIRENKNLSSDFVKREINVETARKSFAYIFLSYESLTYTVQDELANIDIVLLLSNIGGTLGLFLGISVLSLCEVVEICIEVYFVKKSLGQKVTSLKVENVE